MFEALIPVGVAMATGFSVLIRGLYTRTHELDQRIDVFELRVAENYVSKQSFQTALDRVEGHLIRLENKLDKVLQ